MEFQGSQIKFVAIFTVTLLLISSCKIINPRFGDEFYRVDQDSFSQIELRFGEGQNEACVLNLTKEGVLGRASHSFYPGDNKYFFISMKKLDSNLVKKVQILLKSQDYFFNMNSCFCPDGSSLVPPRITYITNPLTLSIKKIYDRGFNDEDRKRGVIMDELYEAMEAFVPENFKNGYCW